MVDSSWVRGGGLARRNGVGLGRGDGLDGGRWFGLGTVADRASAINYC